VGNCCLSIISRTSFGPAVSAVDLAQLTPDVAVTATSLIEYPELHPTLGSYGVPGTNELWNGATQIRGVVFPLGTSSVLFFGRHGLGPYCCGSGEQCSDPEDGAKGDHAYPYAYYVWARRA
jgi:hypothetical protein